MFGRTDDVVSDVHILKDTCHSYGAIATHSVKNSNDIKTKKFNHFLLFLYFTTSSIFTILAISQRMM